MSEQPRAIDGTDFELCEFNDQCESCLHYGPIYFGNKDYWDPREGHYHCEECVRGMLADPVRRMNSGRNNLCPDR